MELVEQKAYGRMVALQGRSVVGIPIEDAVGTLNLVDPEGELVRAAEEIGINFGR